MECRAGGDACQCGRDSRTGLLGAKGSLQEDDRRSQPPAPKQAAKLLPTACQSAADRTDRPQELPRGLFVG